MPTPKLALIAVDRTDRAVTETVIELAGGLEIARWELVDDPQQADLIIIDIDTQAGSRQRQTLSDHSDAPRIVPLSDARPGDTAGPWLQRPITYAKLVTVLKTAQRTLSGTEQLAAPSQNTAEPIDRATVATGTSSASLQSDDSNPSHPAPSENTQDPEDTTVFDEPVTTAHPASLTSTDEETMPPEPETSQSFDTTTDQLIYSTTFSLTSLDVSTEPEMDAAMADTTNQTEAPPSIAGIDNDEPHTPPEPEQATPTPGKAGATQTHTNPEAETGTSTNNVALALDEIIRPAKRFYPQMRLLGILRKLAASHENCLVTHPRFPDIEIHPQAEWFYSPDLVEHTIELFRRPGNEFTVTPIGHKNSPVENDELSRPLWILIWLAALYGSEGRLLEHVNAHKPFKLKELPDSHMIPWPEEYRRIATYLYDYEANLSQVATVTQVPITTVIDFTNACREIGILEEAGGHPTPDDSVELEAPDQPRPKPPQRGLIDKLRSRLMRRHSTR